ncbi:MAG: hypothetical protein ACK52I_23550 [Pseudomonadota bacterium]|jgi:hypothetical protein
MNRASILAFFLVSLLAFALPAQTYCSGFCTSTAGFAAINAPAVVSVSAPFGAVHNVQAYRALGGLDAVAAVCARSFQPTAGYWFPLDPAAGLVLLDVTAPAVIDVTPMSPGAVVGVEWLAAPLFVPNDPALVGEGIHSQAFLLLSSGAWQASHCNVSLLGP